MPDRLFYPLAGLFALVLILIACVYPQGMGARSPGPFGHKTFAQAQAEAKAKAPKPDTKSKVIDANDLKGPL